MIYNFKVSNLVLSCTNGRKVITSDSVNYHTATFTLDSCWVNMTTIIAIFTNSKDNSLSAEQILDVNKSCKIPASPISKDGNLLVKLVGENTSLNQHIETEMFGVLTISPSTVGEGGTDKVFTPNIITQLEDLIDDKGDNLDYTDNILSLKSGDAVLSAIEIGGYVLPTMSTTVKGGAKVGTNLSMNGEILNVTGVVTTETDPTVPLWAKEPTKPTYTKSEVGLGSVDNTSDLNKPVSTATQTALNLKLNSSEKGAINGVAQLDANGLVPSTQLPSYVDDIIEGYLLSGSFYEDVGHTILINAISGKIYVDISTSKIYRWNGSMYVVISDSVVIGETVGTAYDGLKGKTTTDSLNSHIGSGGTSHADATELLSGYMSSSNYTKLGGIEENANNYSLDNAKLSTVLSGANAETTIEDTDTVPFTDVSVSNSTKKIAWSNIKARLKVYFDTLYNNYALPTASKTVKGGVKVDGTSITITDEVIKATSNIQITDTNNYFNSDNVEGVLSEVGVKMNELEGYSYIGYTNSDIYGVEVDVVNKTFTRLAGAMGKTEGADFNSINAFGGRKRCNLTDSGVVTAYYGETAYTETGALTQQIIKNGITYPIGTPVQVMVEQPKFYYKVVPLKLDKIEYKEINTITVTDIPTSNGNLTINLDGNPFTVAVATTDNTTTLVATKIMAAAYAGWTTGGSGASVTFTSTTTGEKVTATFNGGTTGVTATVTKNVSGKAGKGFHMRKARYYVSDVKKSGFKLHPAFIHNGKEKNFIYLSAFEGSLYDVSASAYILNDAQVADFTATTGDKLSSITNSKPISGLTQDLTRAKTRILANNRGTGWQQAYAATIAATQMLFMIEYASFNTQTKIGFGVLNKVDDGATNMAELTGATTNLGNASGSVTNTNGWNVPTYRGEENWGGNIWKWVDGLNIYGYGEHSLYVADNGFTDNISTSPYKDAGITLSRKEGYISAFGYSEDFDWLFMTSETTGDSSLPVGDYFWQNHAASSWFVARLGGSWSYSSAGGGFYWDVTTPSSNRYRYFGGRLVYVPDAA